MRPLRRALLWAIIPAGLIACAKPAPKAMSAFDGYVADLARAEIADSPELATRAGLPAAEAGVGFSRRLDDRSARAVEIRRNAALVRFAQIRGFDRAALDAEDQTTFDVLAGAYGPLASAAKFPFGRFSTRDGFSPYAINQLDAAFLVLPDFFDSRVPAGTLAEARDYLARLTAVADAVDAETERMRTDAASGIAPPDFVIDRTLAALDRANGTPAAETVYVTALRRKLEAGVGLPASGAAAAAAAKGAPAPQTPSGASSPSPAAPAAPTPAQTTAAGLVAQAEALVRDKIAPAQLRATLALRELRPRARHDAGVAILPDGAAYYRAALAFHTTTDLGPDEIHAIGVARVGELTAALDGALRIQGLAEGTVGQRLAQLTVDPRVQYPPTDEGRAQLLADVKARVERMMARAPDWFGALPKAPMDVRRTPALLEGSSSGAYYEPPSLDGRQPGVYYVNLRDLSQMTRIDLPTQDFHEAAPGHHFQIALAQEQTHLPLLRRLGGANAYTEGWALYAEQLADELGFYEQDALGRIGYLRWQLWRAARLVVDTGLHAKGWSREQAIDYLVSVTGDDPAVAVSEVERYAVWPGQACSYEIGRREIDRLREKARRTLGPRFSLKDFHDAVLLGGAMPLSALSIRIDRWIESRKAGGDRS